MGLITIDDIEDGVDASGNLWNTRFGIIADVINGNIEAENIKNGSVTGPKLAAGSVTNDKLALVSDTDNDGDSILFGNFLIQWGTKSVASTGTSIVFATPFTGNPSIVATTIDINQQSPWITSRSTTGFTAKQPYATNPLTVNWIAVGPA